MKIPANSTVSLLFNKKSLQGKIDISYGQLDTLLVLPEGNGSIDGKNFEISGPNSSRLDIRLKNFNNATGSEATIIHVRSDNNPFSFFLRDVNSNCPIYIPEYDVIVTSAGDQRDFGEIVNDLRSRNLLSDFDKFASDEEESYKKACKRNRSQFCPTWLGLGRDMRIFIVGKVAAGYENLGAICMRYHTRVPEFSRTFDPHQIYSLLFRIGPGESCNPIINRKLEDNILPILHASQREEEVDYNFTAFASLENGPVSDERVRGSDWLVSYANTGHNMMTEKEKEDVEKKFLQETVEREEEILCLGRLNIVNNSNVPRYAWYKTPIISIKNINAGYNKSNGFSTIDDDRVYAVNLIDGQPLKDEETAILLQPGESVVIDMIVPHQPIPTARAEKLLTLDYKKHFDACKKYWRKKLKDSANFALPEKTINECVKAGILHCDLATLGKNASGPLLATIGSYSPIGSESSPIIQFFDSVGQHKIAERCLDFFLARQREDGFIQNFGGYQLETGPVLWTMGEHFRYTKDLEWLKRVKEKMLLACDYLLKWRERNKKEEYRDKGFYGMIEGKVADPQDFYHSFMLNALSYVGLKRVAEMLKEIDPVKAEKLEKEVKDYYQDIRNGFYFAMANAPVIPLGDGSWAPFMPPWVERNGACSLYADGQKCFTHGAFIARDNIIGPLYLIISEVLEPEEIGTEMLIKANQHPVTKENAGLTQPYYCRHDFTHLKRGEVKLFLKTYYNQLSALHDRETYTFWEHYYHASQHKTHEEGWFLMQTRWMLYLENLNTLELLKGIPRKWLGNGKKIKVENAGSYFGPISFSIESNLEENWIKAEICCDSERHPDNVTVRLPHPDAAVKAKTCENGEYDPQTETVTIDKFAGKATIKLFF